MFNCGKFHYSLFSTENFQPVVVIRWETVGRLSWRRDFRGLILKKYQNSTRRDILIGAIGTVTQDLPLTCSCPGAVISWQIDMVTHDLHRSSCDQRDVSNGDTEIRDSISRNYAENTTTCFSLNPSASKMTSQLWKTVISVVLIVSLFNERAEAVANAEEVIANSTVTKEFGEQIHDEVLHRMKRFLIFNNGGLVKVCIQ